MVTVVCRMSFPQLRLRGEILDRSGEHDGVGHRDLDVLRRAQARHEQRAGDHRALHGADAHPVAHVEGARVEQHEAGHEIRDRGAGTERDQNAEEDRNALDRVGVRARQVREHQRERQRDDERARDLEGGRRPFALEVLDLDVARPDGVEERAHAAQDHARAETDDDQDHQVGQIVDDRVGRALERHRDGRDQSEREIGRLREIREHRGHVDGDEHGVEHPAREPGESEQEVHHPIGGEPSDPRGPQ